MKIGSLFSGIGGLELGLEWAGVGHTVWQVEQDKFCTQVLAKHWPHAARYDDVRTVGAHNLEPVDVICGGFPCQDISYAGKGAGLEGARSGLWYEYARIIGEMGPRYVVVENVRALLTRGIDRVLGTLADLGYDAEWSTLRASDVGAPHRRERVFLIAWLADAPKLLGDGCRVHRGGDLQGCQAIPEFGECRANVGISTRIRRQWSGSAWGRGERPTNDGEGMGDANHQGLQGHGRSVGQRVPCRWHAEGRHGASAGAGLGWSDATPVRGADGTVRLIPAEAAAMGVESPLYPVADGAPGRVARLRATGNAVVPQCAEVVGRRLLAIHEALNRVNPITGPFSGSSHTMMAAALDARDDARAAIDAARKREGA